MPRQKVISVLALLLTAGYVAFVLLAPASVTKPTSQALVAGLLLACLGVTLRAIYRARQAAAHRNRPHPEHPQPPSPTTS
ncbi:hypothetical protein FAF44_10895 [Nonomuraea sp. MG754425]|uniref:hypothetical protein n=1 Tax=Nonomuraea sp. MG754425 TaxID=2570319 RepID=UPI001F3A0CA7|nr:hypothetical protein [Nonomuraea sp. MG754425]MCF6468892.1 hypothetical protein [Nonomuraea sp. MG754425]